MNQLPLAGIRVLEIGTLVAAPSATRILGDFGADVIKVEAIEGDPLRKWGELAPSGSSWWWYMQARNKRLVSVNLKTAEGQTIVRDLAKTVDILIENQRPGRLASWGLGYEDISKDNPGIIYVSISGYGLTGPYRDRAGFGNIAESMGGLRHVTGFPDGPPMRVGVSLGDEVAAFQAVIGALTALYRRQVDPAGRGDFVDVALTESVLSLSEGMIPEYLQAGIIQQRTGNDLGRSAPSNMYPTNDGRWIAIGANSPGTFPKLLACMDRMDLSDDPRYQTNAGRVAHVQALDALITDWTKQRTLDELMEILNQNGVPAGPVMDAKDIAEDVQYQHRQMIVKVASNSVGDVGMPGVVPKLTHHPGTIRSAGGELGENTEEVLCELLGYSSEMLVGLRARGIVQ